MIDETDVDAATACDLRGMHKRFEANERGPGIAAEYAACGEVYNFCMNRCLSWSLGTPDAMADHIWGDTSFHHGV